MVATEVDTWGPILNTVFTQIDAQLLTMSTYTVGTVPSAPLFARKMIYVSDEAGGATPAFSDGVHWRRTADRAVIT